MTEAKCDWEYLLHAGRRKKDFQKSAEKIPGHFPK